MQKKIREDPRPACGWQAAAGKNVISVLTVFGCHPRPACGWQAAAGRSVQIIAAMEYLLQDKTEKIIQAFFKVY